MRMRTCELLNISQCSQWRYTSSKEDIQPRNYTVFQAHSMRPAWQPWRWWSFPLAWYQQLNAPSQYLLACSKTSPEFRWLVAGFSSWRHGFNPRAVNVGYITVGLPTRIAGLFSQLSLHQYYFLNSLKCLHNPTITFRGRNTIYDRIWERYIW